MSKRYLNIDPDGDYITTDSDRLKQRVMRGVQRPLLGTPYEPERGTRNHEMADRPYDVAIANVYSDTRKYLRKYFPEINSDVIQVKQITPDLIIDFELKVLEDTTNG